jgi:glycosyltransferase involved in cell wall biosynthesis
VLFLGYSFGLPAIAADVGSLKEEIIEGETGFAFSSRDPSDLARKIRRYFASQLFRELESRRAEIKAYANERYSWRKVAAITTTVYSELLENIEVGGQRIHTCPTVAGLRRGRQKPGAEEGGQRGEGASE